MSFDYSQAFNYVVALTGNVETVIDWRAIHDKRLDVPARNMRGTLRECWQWLCDHNSQEYGIFAVINETDGQGRSLSNITRIRAHFIDLDNLSAMANLARACEWHPLPSFAVQSSPNKAHVYWPVLGYLDANKFTTIQRKLIAFFNSDPVIHDLPRVMRVPGFFHCKGTPALVTCYALPGYSTGAIDVGLLEVALAGVQVQETTGGRSPLGTPSLAAPSLDWIRYALINVDPNALDRGEWIALTSAVKQAGWTLTDGATLFNIWSEWCARYVSNDPGENHKQWHSIRETELGWHSIVRRVPAVHAQITLGQSLAGAASGAGAARQSSGAGVAMPQAQALPVPVVDCSGEILTEIEQREWFKGCVFVEKFGEILTPSGRLMNATKFNGAYGGKKFIVDQQAKLTNEPWQAALRSTLGTIPKVDHLRFVPKFPRGELITDELGRKGVNTYFPATVRTVAGDPSPFLAHLYRMFPVESDRRILIEFLAHNAKYPGDKIPWAPLIQSAEGAGKGIIKELIRHMIGGTYIHVPNAQELIESGSKFNAWMRAKLFIMVDEIKVDERRDMIEVLKPMISEAEIEIQGKGHDQEKEDNYSNWCFFSNYKDAIPINKNGRRFAIFYSAIQSYSDLISQGMDDGYFNALYQWLNADGFAIVTHWLRNYPIERGAIPMRAPLTSSTSEALRQSRGPMEQIILDAIEDGAAGFKGGYISTIAAAARIKSQTGRAVTHKGLASVLESLGYICLGRAARAHFAEDATTRATLYGVRAGMSIEDFGAVQGYV